MLWSSARVAFGLFNTLLQSTKVGTMRNKGKDHRHKLSHSDKIRKDRSTDQRLERRKMLESEELKASSFIE